MKLLYVCVGIATVEESVKERGSLRVNCIVSLEQHHTFCPGQQSGPPWSYCHYCAALGLVKPN